MQAHMRGTRGLHMHVCSQQQQVCYPWLSSMLGVSIEASAHNERLDARRFTQAYLRGGRGLHMPLSSQQRRRRCTCVKSGQEF